MHLRYCTAAIAALLAASTAVAQPPSPEPATGEATFNIFGRGHHIGREVVTLARGSSGWIITSTGAQDAPIDLTISRFELRYTADWQPIDLAIDARLKKDTIGLATSFSMTNAINEITRNGTTTAKTDEVSARTIVLSNNFYAGYEALAVRLSTVEAGAELPVYVAPQAEITMTVRAAAATTIDTPSGTIDGRRYDVTFHNPQGPLEGAVTIDAHARLVRLDLPAAGLQVVRTDASGVGVRSQPAHNPTDAAVIIPANGFNLAGTITTPPGTGRLRSPAVVLVGGAGSTDRDETVAGVPIFAQLAKALAEAGYIVVRYDKRGVGQSGGRIETATLNDYADDAIAVVKWIRDRKDVNDRQVAVLGHSEGGFVAMLSARREGDIKALILAAAPGTTGAELILEQQRHQLDTMAISAEEKQQKVELQKKIQDAVVTGKGWEGIPPDVRRQADVPEFRSLLMFDPAAVMKKVDQPVLILQGDLDTQVPPAHAERLAGLARARKKRLTEVVHFSGLNHRFTAATTGEVFEDAPLKDRTISPKVAEAIAGWLKKIW